MMDHPGGIETTDRTNWIFRAPLLAAAALICLINGINLDRRVRAEAPRNPWEATEVLEAWRALRGMPVYDPSPNGHSAHMYGALVPYVQGEIFRWVGPNNISGRLLSLLSALATVTLLAWVLRGKRSAWYFAVAWAVLLAVNFRSWEYFAENRPDMTALMFAALGVLLMGYGQETRRWRYVVLGSLCLVAGFFFKQTAAVLSAVPPIALVLRGRRPTRSEVSFALLPFVLMCGVIQALKVLSPAVYHAMIVVPKAFSLNYLSSARNAWELLLDSPLFLVLLGEWILLDGASFRKDARVLWLGAVLVVTIPYSALTSGKVGGTYNSLLPALFPMMAFCVLRLPRLLKYLERPTSSLRLRLMFGSFLAFLMLLTAFPRLSRAHALFVAESAHDRAYWKVVDLVRKLPGTVICPEDPTIPLYAKSYVGLNIFSEYDTHPVQGTFPSHPPALVLAEIDAADYLVDVHDKTQDILEDGSLRALGFEPVALEDASIIAADYRLWRRTRISAHETLTSNAR